MCITVQFGYDDEWEGNERTHTHRRVTLQIRYCPLFSLTSTPYPLLSFFLSTQSHTHISYSYYYLLIATYMFIEICIETAHVL